jgi:hypothetical protein
MIACRLLPRPEIRTPIFFTRLEAPGSRLRAASGSSP